MKTRKLFQLVLPFLLLCCFSLAVHAQRPTTNSLSKEKSISAADQKAIQEIFKGVDPSKYRLEFDNKKTTVGTKTVRMQDLNQIKRVTNPAESAGYIVFVVEGNSVVYVLAVGSSNLESVIGKQKAAQLNAIITKYK